MKIQRAMAVLSSFALLIAAAAIAQAPDPIIGTWELNPAKSKYESKVPPKSDTRTYVLTGRDISATATTVEADGNSAKATWKFSADYDGKERPVSGSSEMDTLSIKRADAGTFEAVQKRAGKVIATGKRVMSKDGKTMTLTFHGTTASGKQYTDVEVFEKR